MELTQQENEQIEKAREFYLNCSLEWLDKRGIDVLYHTGVLLQIIDRLAKESDVVHAYWKYENNSKSCRRVADYEEWLRCSSCGADVDTDRESKFCSICGAKMDEDPYGMPNKPSIKEGMKSE